jgi:hypothetical protein
MNSFNQLPTVWQCVIVGLAALVAGHLFWRVRERLVEGRKWCLKLAAGCRAANITDVAELLEDVAVLDLVEADRIAVKWAAQMSDPAKRTALLAKAVEDGVQYVAANDAGVAQKLLTILQNGTALKSLAAPAAAVNAAKPAAT